MFFFNKFFLIVNLLLYPFSGLFSQKLDYKDIEFKLNIEYDSIGVMDPLFYQLCLLNNDKDKAKKVWSPWTIFTKPKLEIKSGCNAKWKELALSYYMPELHSLPYYFDYKNSHLSKKIIEIEPNTYICKAFSWINFYNLQGGNWNENCNNYSIRAKLNISKNKKHPRYIYSNEVSLSIISYKGVDSTAFDFLMELKNPPFFLYEIIPYSNEYWGLYSIYNPETFSNANEFLKKFPDSRFSPWAKLHLGYCYKWGIGGIEVELDRAKKIALSLIADNPNSEIKKLAEELLQEINNKDEED